MAAVLAMRRRSASRNAPPTGRRRDGSSNLKQCGSYTTGRPNTPTRAYTPAQLECAWTISGFTCRVVRVVALMRDRSDAGSSVVDAHWELAGVSSPVHRRWCSACGSACALSLTALPTPAPKHSVTWRILSGRFVPSASRTRPGASTVALMRKNHLHIRPSPRRRTALSESPDPLIEVVVLQQLLTRGRGVYPHEILDPLDIEMIEGEYPARIVEGL